MALSYFFFPVLAGVKNKNGLGNTTVVLVSGSITVAESFFDGFTVSVLALAEALKQLLNRNRDPMSMSFFIIAHQI